MALQVASPIPETLPRTALSVVLSRELAAAHAHYRVQSTEVLQLRALLAAAIAARHAAEQLAADLAAELEQAQAQNRVLTEELAQAREQLARLRQHSQEARDARLRRDDADARLASVLAATREVVS